MARYRDSYTGKFVSKSTWVRSKAQGGDRYKRTAAAPVSRKVSSSAPSARGKSFTGAAGRRSATRPVKPASQSKAATSKRTSRAAAPSKKSGAAPKTKTMLRVTVGFKYDHRNVNGQKVSGTSKATTWVRTERAARKIIAKLEQRAEDATNKVINNEGDYNYTGRNDWWFPTQPSKSIQRVPYDSDLLDTIDVVDEEDNYMEPTGGRR